MKIQLEKKLNTEKFPVLIPDPVKHEISEKVVKSSNKMVYMIKNKAKQALLEKAFGDTLKKSFIRREDDQIYKPVSDK